MVTEQQKEWKKTIHTMQDWMEDDLPEGTAVSFDLTVYDTDVSILGGKIGASVCFFTSVGRIYEGVVSRVVDSDRSLEEFCADAEKKFKAFRGQYA